MDVPANLVPLHLVVREYGDVLDRASQSILDHLERTTAKRGASLSLGTLAGLCQDRRAVLLIDGLDEAGDPARREELRGRILAFCALYPSVPVFVTTRGVGYDEVRLPEQGSAAFLHLTVEPLSDADLADFVRRWYTALEPDETARAAGIADLLASIIAEPTVRDLARIPLLATLIALIHRHHRLPGERVKLYDLCIRMLLHDWPSVRDKAFAEIDIDVQRRTLETLAARFGTLQTSKWAGQFLVPRDALLDCVTSALQACESEAGHTRARARRWIGFLHDESGLLSESGPDHFAFVHRSLQEYLVAANIVNSSADPTIVIDDLWKQAEFREVCLMIAGLLATDARASDCLARRVAGGGDDAWPFLLACMGEEAGFSDATVVEILMKSVHAARDPTQSAAIAESLGRVWRFSGRHGAAVRRWLTARLSEQRDALADLVWLAYHATLDCDAVIRALDERDDRSYAAAELAVALWPVEPAEYGDRPALRAVARWAWARLELIDVIDRMTKRRWSATELCGVAYTALTSGIAGPIRGAVALRLALDTLELLHCAAAQPLATRVGGLITRPGNLHIALAHDAPVSIKLQETLGAPPNDDRYHSISPHRLVQRRTHFPPGLGVEQGFDKDVLAHPGLGDIKAFQYLVGSDDLGADSFWIDPADKSRFEVYEEPDEYGDVEIPDFGNHYPLKDFTYDIHAQIAELVVVRTEAGIRLPPPDEPRGEDPYRFRDALMCSRPSLGIDQPPYGAVFTLHALHAAHVAAAAHVYTGEPALRRHAAVLRQQHVWLLQNWHALERLAGVPPDDPATVALLLTLGWVQCTSTSVWPGTPSWRALLGGPPPAHWWPRVHWYFCWLLHAPNCSAYRAGLDVALIEGEVDVALGPLAVALRAVLVP